MFRSYLVLLLLASCITCSFGLDELSVCGNNRLSHTFVAGPKHDFEYNLRGHWPWMASIGYYDQSDEWIHQCGATLISSSHLLTAAHCVANRVGLIIHVGDYDLSVAKADQLGADMETKKVMVHPNYNGKSSYFDVAVIETNPVEFTDFIRPICLPQKSGTIRDFHTVDLLGWGSSDLHGKTSKLLKRVTQTIYPEEYCNSTHSRIGAIVEQIQEVVPDLFQSHVLCAGYDSGKQGACKGDSGGPLQFNDRIKGRYYQVAIVHGSVAGCGDVEFPSVYASLDDSGVLDFIMSAIQQHQLPQEESKLGFKPIDIEATKEEVDEKNVNTGLDLESDWHLISDGITTKLYNWKTELECIVDREEMFKRKFYSLLDGTPIYCHRNKCFKLSNASKEWIEFVQLPFEVYDGKAVILPGKELVLFVKKFPGDTVTALIFDDRSKVWNVGPEISGLNEVDIGEVCVAQIDHRTFFLGGHFENSSRIASYDWTTNTLTAHNNHLLLNHATGRCAGFKDEGGNNLVVVNGNRDDDRRFIFEIWNPANDDVQVELLSTDLNVASGMTAVAVNHGKDLLVYALGTVIARTCQNVGGLLNLESILNSPCEGPEEAINYIQLWKFNLASKTWHILNRIVRIKGRVNVLPVQGIECDGH